ncbi:MAG: hypothetical protein LBT38_08440, partial [Deltaproteobacteria bacterium]|nr:hypothetical protein [Deltaproteobacteria bacterium]
MDLELDNESNHDDIINLANKYSELIKDIFFKDCLNESDSKQYKKINFKAIYDHQRKSITLEKSFEQDEDNEIDASGETVIDVEADLSEASDAEGDHEDGQARLASNGWGDGEEPGQISDLNNEDREIKASLRDWLAEPPTSLNRVNEPNDGQPPDYSGDLNNEDREIEASLRDWLAEPPSSLNRVVDPSDGQPPDFSGDLNNDESSPMGSEASDQQTQSQSEEASDRDRDRNDVRGGSGERGSSKPLSKFSQESHQSVQRASLVLRAKLQGLLQAETLTRDPPGRRGKIVSNRLARIQINEQKLFAPKRFKKHFDTVVHILLDSSMSMGGQKIALANEACYSLALALYPVRGILIGASHFPARGPENPAVAELFLRYGQRPGANFYVKAYGGTPLLKALDETIDLVSQQKSERKLIVVISDGRPNKWD